MSECMQFPADPAEFIEQYSFRDEKEEYTNGSELIAVFRVGQLLEHYYPPARFKPGEEVWVVERDEGDNPCDVAGFIFLAEVAGAVIVTPYINDLEDLGYLLEYHIEETRDNYDTDLSVYPADDCYRHRQAAEDALIEETED